MPHPAFRPRACATLATALFGLFMWWGSVKGNDTGGIIAWQPGIEETALNAASDHCSRWGKYAVITSVHPWPGDYIGFVCRRPDRWGPVSR
jgi:hypothetical protein